MEDLTDVWRTTDIEPESGKPVLLLRHGLSSLVVVWDRSMRVNDYKHVIAWTYTADLIRQINTPTKVESQWAALKRDVRKHNKLFNNTLYITRAKFADGKYTLKKSGEKIFRGDFSSVRCVLTGIESQVKYNWVTGYNTDV